MSTAADKIQSARTALLLDHPFFGVLALRLKPVEDPTCQSLWTDGVTLGYNPKYIETLPHQELLGSLAHEVMHVAAGHQWRRSSRDREQWNDACDDAINPIIAKSGMTLPAGSRPGQEGRSAEWIFDRMPKDNNKGGGGGGGGGGGQDKKKQPPGGGGGGKPPPQNQPQQEPPQQQKKPPTGEVRDAPQDAAEHGASESDWQAATQQAAKAAQAQGKLPAGAERWCKEAAKPKVDWRSVLRRFVQEAAAQDYTWRLPNRRYMAQGLYLPGLRSECMGPIFIAVDTSGSIDNVLLAQFWSEVCAIVDEANPKRVHVVYADAAVARHDVFEQGDHMELRPKGGGGTDFRPAFKLAEGLEERPAAIVYLTDMYGSFPEACDIPTLWASITETAAPFGEVVSVK